MGLGLYYARRLGRRVDFLRQCVAVLETLSHRLRYSATPIDALWGQMASEETFGRFSLVQDTAAGLATQTFDSALRQTVDKAAMAGLLVPATAQLLTQFADGCGRFDLEGQIAHIAAYRQRLAQAAEMAKETMTAKAQVYQMLGLAGGVGVSLLLL